MYTIIKYERKGGVGQHAAYSTSAAHIEHCDEHGEPIEYTHNLGDL